MYTYTIKKTADEKSFFLACKAIEHSMKDLKKKPLLEDVDGTQIQIYYVPEGKIKLINDYEVDAVYVDSEVSLDGFMHLLSCL